MNPLWLDLFGEGPVVLDGGLSTQLEAHGHRLLDPLWTGRVLLEDPAAITRAHADFVASGADVVISASYQVSRRGFESAGLTPGSADAALISSIEAARRATEGTSARVAASVGPYGAILHDGSEYRGRYGLSHDELVEFHGERLAVLATGGADLLAVETQQVSGSRGSTKNAQGRRRVPALGVVMKVNASPNAVLHLHADHEGHQQVPP